MNTERLNELKERAHQIAVEHGFYVDGIRPYDFYFGLVLSEAGEAINADRKGLHADTQAFEEEEAAGRFFIGNYWFNIKDSVEDEIADIVIRLLDFAGLKKYNLHFALGFCPIVKSDYFASDIFTLMSFLYNEEHRDDGYELRVNSLINVIACYFGMLTGSNRDLWWFVERKMKFNEQRPMRNGKKY